MASDAEAIASLRNHEIQNTTASWRSAPYSTDETCAWIERQRSAQLPAIVSLELDHVAGFGSFGPFRSGEGYRPTVEHSVYVDPRFRRRGHGSALLRALAERARATGFSRMIGGISADQAASLALHSHHGFAEVGRLPGVGEKFGRPLDLVLMMLRLDS